MRTGKFEKIPWVYLYYTPIGIVWLYLHKVLYFITSQTQFTHPRIITDNKPNAFNPCYRAVIWFKRRDIIISRTITIITLIIGLMVIIKRIIKIIRIKPGMRIWILVEWMGTETDMLPFPQS